MCYNLKNNNISKREPSQCGFSEKFLKNNYENKFKNQTGWNIPDMAQGVRKRPRMTLSDYHNVNVNKCCAPKC